MKKIKSTLFTMISALSIVTVVSTLAVTGIYIKTTETILQNQKLEELSAIYEIFGKNYDNNPIEEKTIFNDNEGKPLVIYPLRKNEIIYALAINTKTNRGFGGDIDLMTGFYLDGAMAGYKVLVHKETPGLGSKITEVGFMEQFKGLFVSDNTLKLKRYGGEIDGITSATISSKAILHALNRAKNAFDKFSMGARND